jgi:DNA-binding transcriptional MocR family regulator
VAVRYQLAGGTAAEISASVEAGIRSGALAAGRALPPVRDLAEELGVSPATVASAYRGLRDRGLVETAGRAGTRVRSRPPVASRLSRIIPPPPGALDLSGGEPDPQLLPPLGPRLRRIAAGLDPVGYGSGGPLPELLDAAGRQLAAEGVPVHGAGLTVTGGALDGIERVLTAHLRPGDRVAVEDPVWANLLDLTAALGLRTVPVPVDDDGPTADGLRRALAAGAGAVVVTSRAQNPTGGAVSAGRARDLRRILRERPDVLVVEDDHAGALAETALHALAGTTSCWAFLRSVSKPYGADLRTAVLAGDEVTVARVEGRMRLGTGWVSTLLQRLVVELWRDPAVDRIVARARSAYSQRRDRLRTELAARGLTAHGRTGINVWVPVADETAVVARLRDRGYAVAPGSLYRLAAPPGIRVTISPLRTVEAVAELADAIAAAAAPSGGRGLHA